MRTIFIVYIVYVVRTMYTMHNNTQVRSRKTLLSRRARPPTLPVRRRRRRPLRD